MLWRMLTDFGMTPSARARVIGVTPDEATTRGGAASIAEWDKRSKEIDRMIAGA